MKKLIIIITTFFLGLLNFNQSLFAQSPVQVERLQRAIAQEQMAEKIYLDKIKFYKIALESARDKWVMEELEEVVICAYPALQETRERIQRLEKKHMEAKRALQRSKRLLKIDAGQ